MNGGRSDDDDIISGLLHYADVQPASFVSRAIEYFLRQDYANKELIDGLTFT